MAKNPTPWIVNPDAQTNQRVYDLASIVYNSASLTYDGIVTGESPITTKDPIAWTQT